MQRQAKKAAVLLTLFVFCRTPRSGAVFKLCNTKFSSGRLPILMECVELPFSPMLLANLLNVGSVVALRVNFFPWRASWICPSLPCPTSLLADGVVLKSRPHLLLRRTSAWAFCTIRMQNFMATFGERSMVVIDIIMDGGVRLKTCNNSLLW